MFAEQQAKRFVAGLGIPEDVQHITLLSKVIEPNIGSTFGRKHSFSTIKSVADYRKAVPITDYEGLRPDIDRMRAGEAGVLVSSPVRRYFLTSGSASKPKHIPVTSALIRDKSRAFAIFWSLVHQQHPELAHQRIVTNFSDSGRIEATDGPPVSSESAYWSSVTAATQRKTPVLPGVISQIEDPESRYYAIARVLLEEEFAAIMALNPSTILLLFQTLNKHADRLVSDVGRGDLSMGSNEARAYVRERYCRNSRRAQQLLLTAQGEPGLLASKVWPELKLVVSWRSPMLKPYLQLLEPHLSGVAQRDYICMASEGIMAIPLEDQTQGGPVATSIHFYEFIPESQSGQSEPDVLGPEELEVGARYLMVLSTSSGLYRYNIGDVFRVTGFAQKTPVIEFLHRAGATSSLTGEKLTEVQVTEAVSAAAESHSISLHAFTAVPSPEGFPRYILVAELTHPSEDNALVSFLRDFDDQLGAQNSEYRAKRASTRLGAPELWIVAAGSYDQLRKSRVAQGASELQLKPTRLTRDSSFAHQFEIAERVRAD